MNIGSLFKVIILGEIVILGGDTSFVICDTAT